MLIYTELKKDAAVSHRNSVLVFSVSQGGNRTGIDEERERQRNRDR